MRTALAAAGVCLLASAAHAAPTTVKCTEPIEKTVVADAASTSVISGIFAPFPGVTNTVVVPAGAIYCVTVVLTGFVSCSNSCFLQAYANNLAMLPADLSYQPTTEASSYEWTKRLASGTYDVQVRGRAVRGSSIRFDNWTFDVEVWQFEP